MSDGEGGGERGMDAAREPTMAIMVTRSGQKQQTWTRSPQNIHLHLKNNLKNLV